MIISGANQIAPEQFKVFRKLHTGQPDAITIYRARYNGKCSMHAFYGEQRLIRARFLKSFNLSKRNSKINLSK